MSAAETSIIPTILDYLNEDCWQALLDYVPVRDIIRSEGVSKRWQSLVLEYLRHVRIGLKKDHSPSLDSIPLSNVYWLTLKEADSSFRMWTNKLGSSVVAAYCDTEMKFHVIGENCPNLEAVMFYELPETVLNQYYENFKWVHWLSINRCFRVSESCMSRYICGASIKELQLICNEVTSGQCLRSIKSINLTSLSIHQCERLQFHHLLAAGDRLRGLTKLSLLDVSTETYNNIHLLLDKTPKLDHLLVYIYSHNFRDPIRKDELFPAVCRLTGLKRFGTDMGGTEGDLEAVTRCCKELHSLLVEDCLDLTGRGLATVCRHAGARLTRLGVTHSDHLTDDDVERCVRACPNLQTLDVRFSGNLTPRLFGLVRAARRPLLPRTLVLYAHAARLMMDVEQRKCHWKF